MTRPVHGVPRPHRAFSQLPVNPSPAGSPSPRPGGRANDAVSARSRRELGRFARRHQITLLCAAARPPRPHDRAAPNGGSARASQEQEGSQEVMLSLDIAAFCRVFTWRLLTIGGIRRARVVRTLRAAVIACSHAGAHLFLREQR